MADQHGWYSEKQKPRTGTSFFSTPEGGKVEVTGVGKSPDTPPSKFGDERYVGPVTKFVRKGIKRAIRL